MSKKGGQTDDKWQWTPDSRSARSGSRIHDKADNFAGNTLASRVLCRRVPSVGGYAARYLHENATEVAKSEAYTRAFESYNTQLIEITTTAARQQTETGQHLSDAQEAARTAAVDAANTKKRADDATEVLTEVVAIRDSAEEILGRIESFDSVKTSRELEQGVANVLTKDSHFASIVARSASNEIERIGAVLVRANKNWGVQKDNVGYGFAAWKHTDRHVSCPSGSYVTGIRVRYSGTCLNQCDADGGIIREIVLQCHSIYQMDGAA